MNMDAFLDQVIEFGPKLLGAVGFLVGGWILALVVSGILQALFNRTTIDEKTSKFLAGEGKAPKLDKWVATIVKWLIIIWAVILAVDTLGLDAASSPLQALLDQVMSFLPKLGAAAGLGVLAWIVATGVRLLVVNGLGKLGFDKHLNEATGEDTKDVAVSKSIGTAVYWLIWLFFLVPILDTLELDGLMKPLQEMASKVMNFLPNLLSAAIILGIGWFAATIVRRIVTSVLAAMGVDRLADKAGVSKSGKGTLSGLLGTVAFLLILLPVIASGLDALKLDAVSTPIQGLLTTFMEAIPNLLFAAVIIGVAVIVGRLIAGLATDLLSRVGFDNILNRLGLSNVDSASLDEKKRPSNVVGQLIMLAVLLFASMEALDKLGLTDISEIVRGFIDTAGGWVFGLIIFGLALWLANLVAGLIRDRGTPSSGMLALAARIAITVLGAIAALQKMGIAEQVVQQAVTVAIAAIGLAFGLAFGLGCKDQASRQLDEWKNKIDSKKND